MYFSSSSVPRNENITYILNFVLTLTTPKYRSTTWNEIELTGKNEMQSWRAVFSALLSLSLIDDNAGLKWQLFFCSSSEIDDCVATPFVVHFARAPANVWRRGRRSRQSQSVTKMSGIPGALPAGVLCKFVVCIQTDACFLLTCKPLSWRPTTPDIFKLFRAFVHQSYATFAHCFL